MATYLITGGAGFIGRHLGAELIAAGHRVRVLDSLVEQAHQPQADLGFPFGTRFHEGDVRDASALRQALEGVDGVFHLAAEVGVGQSMYEIERYVSANDLGTAVLMQQLIGRPRMRVVVASSMSVYGEGLYATEDGTRCDGVARRLEHIRRGEWEPKGPHGERLAPVPTDETKQPDLASVYALSKYVQEQLVRVVGAAYGIETVALRLFNVFGPGQLLSNPYTGVLAIFAGRLLKGEPPLVFEDGLQRRDFVHVKDVARAFRLAMETPAASGQILNIGSGRSYAVAEVARLLARAMGREDIRPDILNRSRAGDIRHCFADISRARHVLGFEPTLFLEDSVLDLVAWIVRQQVNDRVPQAHRELEDRGLVL